MKLEDGFYRTRFHLPTSIIDNLRSLLFGTIQDVFGEQPTFEKLLCIFCL